jgi:hypothetical protein
MYVLSHESCVAGPFLRSCSLCRTVTDEVVFVPYGKSINSDAGRIKYMADMKGYCREILLPCFDIYEKEKGGLPKHLGEVSDRHLLALKQGMRLI